MVNRYGYTWSLMTETSPGLDGNNDPVVPTETWTAFACDVQSGAGRFVTGPNGDQIAITYKLFVPTTSALAFLKGGTIRNTANEEFRILQFFDYKLNFEIWV